MTIRKEQGGNAVLYGIIALIVIGAGAILLLSINNNAGPLVNDNTDQAMMDDKSDDAMMDDSNDTMMEEKDDAMMEDDSMMDDSGDDAMMDDSSDDSMMENDDVMMKKSDDTMTDDSNDSMMEDDSDAMMDDSSDTMMDDSTSINYQGAVLAGSASPLLDFNQADYNQALNSNKLIVLYYYANWCPVCKVETANSLYPAFNELSSDDVIGFRVNYNDNQTDDDEKDLAREFGIAYQHTKVFLKNGERVLKSPESWDKDRYLEEIDRYE